MEKLTINESFALWQELWVGTPDAWKSHDWGVFKINYDVGKLDYPSDYDKIRKEIVEETTKTYPRPAFSEIPPITDWVKVSEEFPPLEKVTAEREIYQEVLLYGEFMGIFCGQLVRDFATYTKFWVARHADITYDLVTHWMPLPEKPKED